MTGLELQYRLLMRAYPPEHRARHEDEIVSTLLDVATDNQRRPRLREAAAIVTAGVGHRVQHSSELEPGLRLAGVVALAATLAISTMAIVLAAHRPPEIGLVPALAWFAVFVVGIFGAWATLTFRLVPAAIVTLVMITAGSSAMGLRRSTLVPAAVFLILSTFSRPALRSVRLAAQVVGTALGALVGFLVAADIEQVFQNSDSPWVYVAQWDIASDLVPANSPFFFVVCLVVAVAAVLLRQLRYAVAASVLATPLAPAMLFGERGLMPSATASQNLVFLSVVAAALTLGVIVSVSWSGHRRTGRVDRST